MQTQCGDIMSVYSIGTTVELRPLNVARFGLLRNGTVPAVRLVGGIRGNEVCRVPLYALCLFVLWR